MYIKAIQNVMIYEIFATFRNRQHGNKYQAARIISEWLTMQLLCFTGTLGYDISCFTLKCCQTK